MADLATYFKELVAGERKGAKDRLLLAALRLAAHPYGAILSARALAYRTGLLRSYRLPRPVISVGNVTLGGAGKTPMTAHLASMLIGKGLRVAVLSRGYGGSAEGTVRIVSDGKRLLATPEEAGDEPCQLARKVPGLMVVIGSNRYRAGQLAMKELNPDVFILDDGFQHLRLKRDLNLLLVDAAKPFADGHTLPAGFLREGKGACRRADLVVYTRCGDLRPDLFPDRPKIWTDHTLTGMVPLEGGERVEFASLQGNRVTAFSGIADPAAFFDLLESCGVRLIAALSFPDHTSYGEEELAAIKRLKDASRSSVLITTEKDAIKLADHATSLAPVLVAQLDLTSDDWSPLDQAVKKLL
ncbi:tetraacyldisaccharide 4'-kinase [Geomonas sp. Red32]|uniref:tetraacyldisaccharide 4'-kinase n=1 Tax=Geomonas sp. Red32 TaxID=2912856 RepID=UPI00202CA8F4|nr:tetraacyldisaccharide 4'-kinase [Geomonas sp. Red32]